MRRLLTSLLLVVLYYQAGAQIVEARMRSTIYNFSHFWVTVSNHFTENSYKYVPQEIKVPILDTVWVCYGALIKFSAVEMDSCVHFNRGYTAGMLVIRDSVRPAARSLGDLRVRVWRNDSLLREGILTEIGELVQDSILYREDRKPIHTYSFVHDSLQVGDRLTVDITNAAGDLVMHFRARRESAYTRPLICGSVQDFGINPLDFISRQVLTGKKFYETGILGFYDDWPPHFVVNLGDQEMPAGTNLAYNLRLESKNGTDSVYEMRLLRSDSRDTAWRKCNWQVIIPVLERGVRYELQIRYADGSGTITSRRFHTPRLWYQLIWVRVIALAAGVVLILAIWLLYIFRRNARRSQVQRLEMQAVYSQVNPHFVFNALNSIQGLMNDGQIERANRYLSDFAGLLRNTFLQGQDEWVTLQAERKAMDQYLVLEQLRFGFGYTIDVDPGLADEILVPRLLTQPLIENAVKHGMRGLGDGGHLSIRWCKDGRELVFLLKDNGPGFDASKDFEGQGLRLTKNRIRLLNRLQASRSIVLSFPDAELGSICMIRFKNWLPV